MRYKTRKSFMMKLALSIIALSIVGLVAMFVIVNTIVRSTIYNNVIGVAHGDVRAISMEIDAWFNTSNHIVNNLSRLLPGLGIDSIKPISDELFSHKLADRIVKGYTYLMPFYDYFITLDYDPDPDKEV